MSLKKRTWFSIRQRGKLKKGEYYMLNDEDIVYEGTEEEPAYSLAMDENYVELKPTMIQGKDLTAAQVATYLNLAAHTNQDADLMTPEGLRFIYDAAKKETKTSWAELPPACKFFSPTQEMIDETGALPAREYKYDKAYRYAPCCQSRLIDSPYCQAVDNQADCMAYQPEQWQPVRLAKTADDRNLEWVSGRLYSGVPYGKITSDGKITVAATGESLGEFESAWDKVVQEADATELPLPENGPKNPYLQSLLV